MVRAVVVLAEGFEEIEAVTPVDVLRRAGVDVVTAGVSGRRVQGSHGIAIEADTTLDAIPSCDVVILPGGMPGSDNLRKSEAVQSLVREAHAAGKHVAAICAAPALALSGTGVLDGKRATCYPGLEKHFGASVTRTDERVVVDGKVVTSRGPGTALEFSLALVEQLVSKQKADELREGMLVL
jgi:protein deglycase